MFYTALLVQPSCPLFYMRVFSNNAHLLHPLGVNIYLNSGSSQNTLGLWRFSLAQLFSSTRDLMALDVGLLLWGLSWPVLKQSLRRVVRMCPSGPITGLVSFPDHAVMGRALSSAHTLLPGPCNCLQRAMFLRLKWVVHLVSPAEYHGLVSCKGQDGGGDSWPW